jgi:hypothetical protein
MGQAAGTAAHLALKAGVVPRSLATSSLQKALERDGAYLGSDLKSDSHAAIERR